MNLQDNVLIRKSAIGADDLEFLVTFLRHAQMTDSLVSHFDEDADSVEWVVNKKVRDTQEVVLTDAALERANSVIDNGARSLINPYFDVIVRDWERLQILHYGACGHYIPHVDAESLLTDELGLKVWEKTLDRDLSIVYFLNDDYEGGELAFPDFNLTVKPEAGTLVCFPSDHNYVHGVRPVTTGHRYTLVTWMRVEGTPTMDELNERTRDEYNRTRPRQIDQWPRVRKGGIDK